MSWFIWGTIALYCAAGFDYLFKRQWPDASLSFVYALSNYIAFAWVSK